jgi:hypothetical protein
MDNDPDVQQPPKQTLKSARCLRVPVLGDDEAIIKANAKAARLSTAEFLRRVGRGEAPASTLDLQAVDLLAKVNADQGRLGGLLKLWLTDDPKWVVFVDQRDVRSVVLTLLQQIRDNQKKLQAVMLRIVDGSASD